MKEKIKEILNKVKKNKIDTQVFILFIFFFEALKFKLIQTIKKINTF